MFNSKNVPMYLRDLNFTLKTKGDTEERVVHCTFLLQPFTASLAREAGASVHARLFKRADGERIDDVQSIALIVANQLQTMRWKAAPDATGESLVLLDVHVDPILKVRADKETPTWAATIRCNFTYPEAAALLYLVNGLNKQHFITFEDQQGSLLNEEVASCRS